MENKKSNKVIVTYNSPFLNSDSLLVEYDDVLKSPFFIFLLSIKDNEALKILFKLTELEDLDIDSLYEWYLNRKNKNIFKCLPLNDGILESYFDNDMETFEIWCDKTLYELIDQNPYFVEYDSDLNFMSSFHKLLSGSLVKKYYIYTRYFSNAIKEDIERLFGERIKYVYGNLEDIIKVNNITSNSTFIFSDIKNILSLKNANVLQYSSVIIADKYGYNYKDNKDIINIDDLLNSYTFKLDFFDNINEID